MKIFIKLLFPFEHLLLLAFLFTMYIIASSFCVSGHKSVSSLAVYQRVSDKEKLAMGNTIATHVDATSSGAQMALPAPPVRLAIQGPVATCQPSSSGVLALPAPDVALLPPTVSEAQGDCRDLADAVMDVTEGDYTQ